MYLKKPCISDSNLRKLFFCVFGLWLVIQICLIAYFWDAQQYSDPQTYMRLATRCNEQGQWYPNLSCVNAPYIWNPAFINFLVLQLKIFNTLDFNSVLNFIFNVAIVGEILFISRRFFSERTAYWAAILYCLTYSNTFIIISAGTEVPFLFLALSAFCLCLSNKYVPLCAAGLVFALANWTRPFILPVFAPAVILLFILQSRKIWTYAAVAIPYILLTLIIGKCNYDRMGYFITQSTTSSLNLIMTANDNAYGGVATSIFTDKKSIAYIENADALSFDVKSKIWRERAVDWIKKNPTRYCMLYFKKLFGLYAEDSWADRPILGKSGFVDAYFVQKKISTAEFVKQIIIMASKSVVYYAVLLLFAFWIVKYWREIFTRKSVLFTIIVFGTLLTCIFCVSPRYHYPMYFAIVIFAADALNALIPEKKLI